MLPIHEISGSSGKWGFKGARGIVPNKRDRGQTHRIRVFPHLIDGVKAYAKNLNTHPVYRLLRGARAKLRAADKLINGAALAPTLVNYSERREKYVEAIETLEQLH